MKKLIAILAVLCLLCGCAAPAPAETAATTAVTTEEPTLPKAEQICDTWQTTLDCKNSCEEYVLALMGPELAAYFDFTGTTVDATLTLMEDGTFRFTISQEAVDAYTQQIEQVMQRDLRAYLENLLKEKLGGRTMDEYMSESNVTMEGLLADAGIDMALMCNALLEQLRLLPCSGTYFISDEMLHIAGTVCAFTLTETTLSIDAPEDSADLASFPALFPLEFTR